MRVQNQKEDSRVSTPEKNPSPVWRLNESTGLPQPMYKPAFVNEDTAAGVHIVYAVFNPGTKQYMRHRVKLNKYRKNYKRKADFMRFAEGIANQINVKLAGGWSPIGETHNARFYMLLADVVDLYLKDRKEEVRHATYVSYSSTCSILKEWVNNNLYGCQIIDFNRVHALEFLQYVREERGVSNRTYNNYLKQLRLFFEWAIGHCYCKEDPFKLIKTRKKEIKKRHVISLEQRTIIFNYLRDRDPAFLIFIELVYFSLMRPMEIRRCLVNQIHLDEHYIEIPEEQAKCWKMRHAPLSDELVERIRDYLAAYPHTANSNLFSTGFRPGSKPIGSKSVQLRWMDMRKELDLPEEYVIYSLRDSGIVEMLHAGVDELTVMHAAGHHDLSTTSIYADHIDTEMIERVREKQVGFSGDGSAVDI
ncbi:MAG: site-specific integrase [Paludibacteraceae bacterium]|nr:site-specific integrase [Paludibacteraceae bacterium]